MILTTVKIKAYAYCVITLNVKCDCASLSEEKNR